MSNKYYYICNFNNEYQDIHTWPEYWRRVWYCQWSPEQLRILMENVSNFLDQNINESIEKKQDILIANTVELLLIFVQNNFTGPFDHLPIYEQIITDFYKHLSLPLHDIFIELQENGEELNPNMKLGIILQIVKRSFEKLLEYDNESVILHWWYLRCICIHQHVLDALAANLYELVKREGEWLLVHSMKIQHAEYETLLYVEIANAYLQFHRPQKSEEILQSLCKHLNVEMNIRGILGVRTKFQEKPLPQLCLNVETCVDTPKLSSAKDTNGEIVIPKLLLLDDDTRLERIRFIEQNDNEVMTLPCVLQCLVLAKLLQLKRSAPKDRLTDEELEPYLSTLLFQEYGPLQVRNTTLLLNCIQESGHRRTIERSWKQCEEIVKLLFSNDYVLKERFSYCFAGSLQPHWKVQKQLCEILISLGMIKSALDIYLKIQAWEHAINCYTILSLRHKAAELIQQELKKKPTVLLYCLLGDATGDPDYYKTAWEFSKETSGKAQADWGNYFFNRKEYEKAIPHLQKSVQINTLQEKIWLRLGYAAIAIENWSLAVHAYITYTHLEPLGFESWNNLAKALIKLGDKGRAHRVLAESLKCNFTNWKVWENFMIVSLDTGHFDDVINAYNRLIELKTHYLDLEVLDILMTTIANGKSNANGKISERLLKKAINLISQQCVQHSSESKVWQLAALLAQTPLKKSEKLVQALRAYTVKELNWTTKQPNVLKVLQLCKELSQHSLEAITNHSENESSLMITSQLNSTRLTNQGCIRAIQRENVQFPENENILQEVLTIQDEIILQVKQRITS